MDSWFPVPPLPWCPPRIPPRLDSPFEVVGGFAERAQGPEGRAPSLDVGQRPAPQEPPRRARPRGWGRGDTGSRRKVSGGLVDRPPRPSLGEGALHPHRPTPRALQQHPQLRTELRLRGRKRAGGAWTGRPSPGPSACGTPGGPRPGVLAAVALRRVPGTPGHWKLHGRGGWTGADPWASAGALSLARGHRAGGRFAVTAGRGRSGPLLAGGTHGAPTGR